MDAQTSGTRKFPAYTTAQLRTSIEEGVTEYRNAGQLAAITEEVARRDAGLSVAFKVPQIVRFA